MSATTKYIRDLINEKGIISIMCDADFDCKRVTDEVIELFKKNNLTFSQTNRVISSVHRELEKRLSNTVVN